VGQRVRTRQITTPVANGGLECTADLEQAQSCSYHACPVRHGWCDVMRGVLQWDSSADVHLTR
jgi:hypothetical protein